MSFVEFDGCMLGLKGRKGLPIKKPWMFASNCDEVMQLLEGYLCDESHDHEHCAGGNTKATESYTMQIVSLIHRAFRDLVNSAKPKVALPCLRFMSNDISIRDLSFLHCKAHIRKDCDVHDNICVDINDAFAVLNVTNLQQ